MPLKKTLILVRHGHRNKTLGRERDNGLSKTGRVQAVRAAKHYRWVYGDKAPFLVSSPKLRCLETLEPLGKLYKTPIDISELLNEQSGRGTRELDRDFNKRLQKFFRWWKTESPPLVVACSHGDWIPCFLELVTQAYVDLKKGGWAELELEEGKARITWLLQELDEG